MVYLCGSFDMHDLIDRKNGSQWKQSLQLACYGIGIAYVVRK